MKRKRMALRGETVRVLRSAQLSAVVAADGLIASYADGCLSTSYHGGDCNSGQASCDPASCTGSTSG